MKENMEIRREKQTKCKHKEAFKYSYRIERTTTQEKNITKEIVIYYYRCPECNIII